MDKRLLEIYRRALIGDRRDHEMYSDPKLESKWIGGDTYEIHLNRMMSGGPGADYVQASVILLEPPLDEVGECWDVFINGKPEVYAAWQSSKWDWGKYETRRQS